MALVLLSGRPGTGKTAYGGWLAEQRGFVYVDSDKEWHTWGPRLCVQTPDEALVTRNLARSLGSDAVVEWGFLVQYLPCVRSLRTAGFDTWWFDGDEPAARAGYIVRRGDSPPVMNAYSAQVAAIESRWPEIQRLYGDHVIRTVTNGPTYRPFDQIAAEMFPPAPAAD